MNKRLQLFTGQTCEACHVGEQVCWVETQQQQQQHGQETWQVGHVSWGSL